MSMRIRSKCHSFRPLNVKPPIVPISLPILGTPVGFDDNDTVLIVMSISPVDSGNDDDATRRGYGIPTVLSLMSMSQIESGNAAGGDTMLILMSMLPGDFGDGDGGKL